MLHFTNISSWRTCAPVTNAEVRQAIRISSPNETFVQKADIDDTESPAETIKINIKPFFSLSVLLFVSASLYAGHF